MLGAVTSLAVNRFLSTLSLRRATPAEHHASSQQEFLSTLSLRRATVQASPDASSTQYFYPRSPCGERLSKRLIKFGKLRFLSTLSLRRATIIRQHSEPDSGNFYPRSPCGERHKISAIHIAGENFYPRSPCGERLIFPISLSRTRAISIHALLAESDRKVFVALIPDKYFYPRSPCGERRLPTALRTPHHRFLSTLSLRRATHAEPAEQAQNLNFYPRSPCGERRLLHGSESKGIKISIHALLAESDVSRRHPATPGRVISIHALLAESDVVDTVKLANAVLFLSTLSLRRATTGILLGLTLHKNFYPRSPCGERQQC